MELELIIYLELINLNQYVISKRVVSTKWSINFTQTIPLNKPKMENNVFMISRW